MPWENWARVFIGCETELSEKSKVGWARTEAGWTLTTKMQSVEVKEKSDGST